MARRGTASFMLSGAPKVKVVRVAGFVACIVAGAVRAPAETRIGVLAGIDVATLHQTDPSAFAQFDYRSVGRFAAGAVVELGGGRRMALVLEPMYAARGSRYLDPGCPCLRPVGYVPQENDLSLSYLELPVLLTVSFGRGSARPYLLAGPSAGHLAGATVRQNHQAKDVRSSTGKWDVAASLGAGLRLGTGRTAVALEVRYGLGLLSVDDWSSYNRGTQVLGRLTRAIGRR